MKTNILFARTQSQAAFAAFGQRVHRKWSFVARTVSNTAYLLAPLEEKIRSKLIPAITDHIPSSVTPCHAGPTVEGWRAGDCQPTLPCLPAPGLHADHQVSRAEDPPTKSVRRRRPGCRHHSQGRDCFPVTAPGKGSCCPGHCHRHQHCRTHLAPRDRKGRLQLVDMSAPSTVWFQPTQAGILGRPVPTLWLGPSRPANGMCVAKRFHQNTCCLAQLEATLPYDNDLRDLTTSLLREVARDVQIEPHLQPLTGETFCHRSAIESEDGACLDVAASSVWGGRFERALLEIRAFNPHAHSNHQQSITATYRKHGVLTKNASTKSNTLHFPNCVQRFRQLRQVPPPLS